MLETLEAFIFSDVDNHDFAILDRLVSMIENRVELNSLSSAEFVSFGWKTEKDFAGEDPANLVVVAMHFGARNLSTGLGATTKGPDVRVLDGVEVKASAAVDRGGFFVGGSGFGEGEQVGGAHSENAAEFEERFEFGDGLISLEF